MGNSQEHIEALPPNSILGVLGSGQLGMMFAEAAHEKGYRVAVLSPEHDAPAGKIADFEFVSDYDDEEQLEALAKLTEAVTVEFENIPAASLAYLAERKPTKPAGHVLATCQNRLKEKTFIKENKLPVTPFWVIESLEDLEKALSESGYPAILKTAGFGYDGKGQAKITETSDTVVLYEPFIGKPAVLEAFVDFKTEFSIVGVRNEAGEMVTYPAIENHHENHILSVSYCPALEVPDSASEKAQELTRTVLEKLNVYGVLCVEFFLTASGDVLINEMAPRPHNSGHLTIEAFNVSQFDQQVAVLVNETLEAPKQVQPAVMINILGDLWSDGEPDWERLQKEFSTATLHLYGKKEARVGRKMGHITLLAKENEELKTLAEAVKQCLQTKTVAST